MVDMGWVGSGSGDHIEKLVQSILKKRRKKKKEGPKDRVHCYSR